jgi:hypothetical protein
VPPDANVYAQGICNYFARCVPALVRSNYGNVASCVEAFVPQAAALFDAPGANVTKRTLDACILRTESARCDEDIEALPECDLRGTLADGAACLSGISCTSGSCFKPLVGGRPDRRRAACGVCSRRVAENESCKDAACAPGLDCVEDRCVAPAGAGSGCSAGHRCKEDLACLSGTCVVPRGRDESCDRQDPNAVPCDASQGLVCSETTKTCTAFLAQRGASCKTTPFCEASTCVNETCVPGLVEGEPCEVGAAVECVYPLECHDGTCAGPNPATCK